MPSVPLSRLPSGSDVFLDANVIVYGLLSQSVDCHDLLRRCQMEDVFGVTSLDVINDVTHLLMLHEAFVVGIIGVERPRHLKRRVREITRLGQYWVQTRDVLNMNILVLPVDERWLHKAHRERAAYGLMTKDSLIVAAMREHGLTAVASADGDFDHVLGLTRYMPLDLSSSS